MVISPCISICKTDPVTGFCYGCGRTNIEKKEWKFENTTDEWKKQNILEIKKRKIYQNVRDSRKSNARKKEYTP